MFGWFTAIETIQTKGDLDHVDVPGIALLIVFQLEQLLLAAHLKDLTARCAPLCCYLIDVQPLPLPGKSARPLGISVACVAFDLRLDGLAHIALM